MESAARMLPGEDPSVTDPFEVENWIGLYEQRQQIWESRLRRCRLSEEKQQLQSDLAWLRERLDFWRRRHQSLSGLQLDPARRTITGASGTVSLTRREYQLLAFLADHPGRHFPAALLVMRAWPDADLVEEQLRTYLGRVRRKLADAGAGCRIVAERPRGYSLLIDDDEQR